MDIGRKLYELRTSKLMTQAELAGDQISRNMLSLIESGKAQPSLPTVVYLAKRLNVPVGYLLAEKSEDAVYQRIIKYDNIKKAYADSDKRICRDLCLAYFETQGDDDEIALILAECDLAIAREEFSDGHLKTVVDLLTEALEYADRTIYYTKHIVNTAALYGFYLSSISPTLDMGLTVEKTYLGEDALYAYLYALAFPEEPRHPDLDTDFAFSRHLTARKYMRESNYAEAGKQLEILLHSDEKTPKVLLYDIFSDLECCCKETGDYKGAYEYAADKRQCFEKMLSDR